jgi:hypothetical protein
MMGMLAYIGISYVLWLLFAAAIWPGLSTLLVGCLIVGLLIWCEAKEERRSAAQRRARSRWS